MEQFSWKKELVYGTEKKPNSEIYISDLKDSRTGKCDKILQQYGIIVQISKLIPEQYSEICTFYLKQNMDENGDSFIIEPNTLQKLSKLDAMTIQLHKENKIIGCVIILIIPVTITSNNFSTNSNTIHTSFLCIDKKYRKQGLAGILIRQVIEYGMKIKIYSGIHILQEPKYECPQIDIYCSIIPELKTNLQSNVSKLDPHNDNNVICNPILLSRNDFWNCIYFWNSSDKGNKILFNPSDDYFQKWCSAFDTYCIKGNINNIIYILCVFSLFKIKSLLPDGKVVEYGYLSLFKLNETLNLFSVQQPTEYRQIMTRICYLISDICSTEQIKLLLIPDMGYISADILLGMNAIKNDQCSYFGTYNLNLFPKSSEIFYPYF